MSFDAQKLALQALVGHGHVKPRPDGVKMRCGGPAICRVCQQEKSQLEMSQRINEAFHPLDGQHINQGSMDAAAESYEREYLLAKIDARAAEIAQARQTADYWKAEHNAANAEIARLREALHSLNEAANTVAHFGPGHRGNQWLTLSTARKAARAALSGEPT